MASQGTMLRLWPFRFLLAIWIASFGTGVVKAVDHPFMIVQPSEYEAMRDLVDDPSGFWSKMKNDAINYFNSHSYNPNASLRDRYDRMAELMSTGSLAYILDPDNASTYVDKLKTTLNEWAYLHRDDIDEEYDYFVLCVRGGNAFLHSTLALDVIRDELTSSERATIESSMQRIADFFYSTAYYNWRPNAQAVYGSWGTYMGDTSRANTGTTMYRDAIEDQINAAGPEGGIYAPGTGYAWARYTNDRATKAYYMDVLDYMGEDEYYNDPKVVAFNEWLYGGAVTPLKSSPSFGDANPVDDLDTGISPFRAGRFSEQAGKNAAWFASGRKPGTGLLAYALAEPLPEAEVPKSRVWMTGYAAFWEKNSSSRALAGYLWTPDYPASGTNADHAHKDVNAIFLTAYGENVLLNSGYAGFGSGISGSGWSYSWDWIHNQAESSNTVLLDGANHLSKRGGGMEEGFTGGNLDYTCGNSGPAIDGTHRRNLLFVHPNSGANGYWILFDEIAADRSKHSSTQVLLHPNSKDVTTVANNQEYRAVINGLDFGWGNSVDLNMYLGTAPTSVAVKKGGLAASGESFEGEYLYSNYALNAAGKKNVVTVLFPEDYTHAKATMTRITGSGFSGAAIQQGNIVDYAIESDGTTIKNYGDVSFRGLATLYRMNEDDLDFYFVRQGRLFDDGQTVREGFSSTSDISIYLEDMMGSIISSGTNVTLYYPGIIGLKLNDTLVSVLNSGEDWIEVIVPAGTWQSEIIPDNYAPVAINDAFTLDEDVKLMRYNYEGTLINDTDDQTLPENLLSFEVIDPSHGTLVLYANGAFQYTPDADYHGTDSFTYRAYDGELYSNEATVTLTIASVNDAPVAIDDEFEMDQNGFLTVYSYESLQVNDIDPDNEDDDPYNDDVLLVFDATDPEHGSLQWYSGGGFRYTPMPGFVGTDSFTYRVTDGEDVSTELGTVLIHVLATIDIPGDTNGDNVVNETDASVLANNWGEDVSGGASMGDFNGDGHVDAVDASILAANWGDYTEASSRANAVPEPSALALLLLAIPWALIKRRQR